MSQKTLTAALALPLLLASCGGAGAGASGDRLYLTNGCSSCHGATGSGGALGPPLEDLARFWDRDSLSDFFKDPKAALASDARLAKVSEPFRAKMPAFPYLTDEQAGRIADFVLSLK